MVLDLEDKKLFKQKDVRETPASTATATAVGLTDPQYLTLALHADLTDERVLTAGEGIDFTDTGANGTLTINGEDSTAGNKGIVIVAGGEGMDVSYSAGTATVIGEDATTANKGIASFNSSDFAVSTGAVSLKNKTSYLSISAQAFTAANAETDDYTYVTDTTNDLIGTSNGFTANVSLPHGAVVTGVIIYGSDAGLTWNMERSNLNSNGSTNMATSTVGTEDTSITNATIDNSTYRYSLTMLSPSSDRLYGARITYTTNYI